MALSARSQHQPPQWAAVVAVGLIGVLALISCVFVACAFREPAICAVASKLGGQIGGKLP